MKGRKTNRAPKGFSKGAKIPPATPFAPGKSKDADEMPPVMGGKARMRLDRPGRKLGGRVGADLAPMSTAAKRCD